jgi:hypothetical protein
MSSDHQPHLPDQDAQALESRNGGDAGRVSDTWPAKPLADRVAREARNHKGVGDLALHIGGTGTDADEGLDLAAALARMQAAGLVLRAKGERLHYRSPVPLTATQLEFLGQHKAELLRLLTPPPIISQDQEAIQEAIAERAAIREFDGGESRAVAEGEVRSAMRVYQYRITNQPGSWLTLIAPGCDLAEARRIVANRFCAARLLDLVPHRASGIRARSPDEPPRRIERGNNT